MKYLHVVPIVLLLAALLSACSAAGEKKGQQQLAGACQVRKCACGPAGWSSFMPGGDVPVEWRENGDAYCPDGYMLHAVGTNPATAR
jgi:hypothetical protein